MLRMQNSPWLVSICTDYFIPFSMGGETINYKSMQGSNKFFIYFNLRKIRPLILDKLNTPLDIYNNPNFFIPRNFRALFYRLYKLSGCRFIAFNLSRSNALNHLEKIF